MPEFIGMSDEAVRLYWITNTPGLTRRRTYDVIEAYGTKDLWDMSYNELASLPQLTPQLAAALCRSRDEGAINQTLESYARRGIWMIYPGGPGFPEILSKIPDPPLLLYGLGHLPSPRLPKIAVIGSRECSEYGLSISVELSRGLSKSGFVIVSGLARGIDGAAHKAALDTCGPLPEKSGAAATIAVLGCGVDICYPPGNRVLYERIIQDGCILSEYPPGAKVEKHNFPQRNRIISGLSLGIVVVEAAARSGTSITVNAALDQGREVFVVPGSVRSRLSVGTNSLIKAGAVPITSYEDIIYTLRRELGYGGFLAPEGGWDFEWHETLNGEHNTVTEAKRDMTVDEVKLYKHISSEPRDISCLTVLSGLAPQDVMYLLTRLELAHYVKSLPGQRFIKL